jgi:hypothetical protein
MFLKGIQQGWQTCWAGCLEWVLGFRGINIPQANIIVEAKGQLVDETITEEDFVEAFDGLCFPYGDAEYEVRCDYVYGPYRSWVLKNQLNNYGPCILSVGQPDDYRHAVVMYGAAYTPKPFFDELQCVAIFDPDPFHGGYRTMEAQDYLDSVNSTINVSVNKL